MSLRKVIRFSLAGCLVFLLLLVLLSLKPKPRKLDLRIVGQPQMTNGAMLISLILSNGTSRSLNIVDESSGGPLVVLDAGTQGNTPGTIGLGLGNLVNTLKLNLAPGASLTKTVTLTNPPPRFRLLVEVRDPPTEPIKGLGLLFKSFAAMAKLRKQLTPPDYDMIMLPASPWIEDGKIATTIHQATE